MLLSILIGKTEVFLRQIVGALFYEKFDTMPKKYYLSVSNHNNLIVILLCVFYVKWAKINFTCVLVAYGIFSLFYFVSEKVTYLEENFVMWYFIIDVSSSLHFCFH